MPQLSALDYFHKGYNCAQSVFVSCAEEMGMDEKLALRLSSGFGAGVGRMRGMCGAFSGMTMVAGFCHGNLSGDPADKEKTFALVRQLADEFRTEFGDLACKKLLNLDDNLQESARPSDRTAEYYAARPCERCVDYCSRRAKALLSEYNKEANGQQ